MNLSPNKVFVLIDLEEVPRDCVVAIFLTEELAKEFLEEIKPSYPKDRWFKITEEVLYNKKTI